MPAETLQVQPGWLDPSFPRKGRYILGPALGQGGMGEVREAWDVVLRRTVALKILRAMDPVSLIRFMHEAQIHARVVHPNICRIYDVDDTEGAPRIAMQLVRGATLAELAHQLTLAEILDLFTRVAEAVHAAHKLHLIHRDLKPSNILMESRAEGGWTPYVCDFGLAMALDEPALTYSQGIKGTPAYMAPEQIRGDRHLVGPATDVYALGGTLYYALYDQVPMWACMDAHSMLGLGPRPQTLPRCPNHDLPRDLETLLQKCMEPDPARRFQSMAALAAEFRRVARGEPIHTRPTSGLRRWLPVLKGHGKTAGLGLLAAGGLTLALGLAESRISHHHTQRAEWTRRFALEAADLENQLRVEKMLPVHDLRPVYTRIERQIEGIQARIETLGPEAEGPGRYALGQARFLMRDYRGARQDLEQAWTLGNQGPEVALSLAKALVVTEFQDESQTRFDTGQPHPPGLETARRVEELFRLGSGWNADSEDLSRALLAFSQRDYPRAAAAAHASFADHPWLFEAATLEGLSLYAQGQEQARSGDPAGAEHSYREAMASAQHFMTLARSDVGFQHTFLLAGRGLATLQWARGTLTLDTLTAMQRQCQEALRLDPDQEDLQDDHLALSILKAACLRNQGRDPQPELASALAFLDARARAPLSPELKADRMLLHWGLAERQFARGQDPRPELAEALKDAGHTRFLDQDCLPQLMAFKAQVEAGPDRGARIGPGWLKAP